MAIAFAKLSYLSLSKYAGTLRILCYNSRSAGHDKRLDAVFDFTKLSGDLVYSSIRLPDDAPIGYLNVDEFANSNDAIELKRVRSALETRQRLPQIGVSIILALPPDSEITLDEAIELALRMADRVRGGHRLGAHIAIHDPAKTQDGAVNRHAHIFLPLREIGPDGFEGNKVRELTARLRHTSGSAAEVTEATSWPDVVREMIQAFFAELGLEQVVDPTSPFPQPHWEVAFYEWHSASVSYVRSILSNKNMAAIHGSPSELIGMLLRGRGTLEILELRRFLADFLDSDGERSTTLERILADRDVLTLSESDASAHPRFITNTKVNHAISCAIELVDRSFRGTKTIYAAMGFGHDDVVDRIASVFETSSDAFKNRQVLIAGENLSDCDAMALKLKSLEPKVMSLTKVLGRQSWALVRAGKPNNIPLRGLIIVPASGAIPDQKLARLLELADRTDTLVILGKDLSKAMGVVSHRLASHAAGLLADPAMTLQPSPDTLEQFLRAGMIAPAVARMSPNIQFALADRYSSQSTTFEFVVCTNAKAMAEADQRQASLHARACGDVKPLTCYLSNGLSELWPGQPVVFTQTTYVGGPFEIRAGQIAIILKVDHHSKRASVTLQSGKLKWLDEKELRHLRSGFALSLREARQLQGSAALRIEITDARHAWAGLLLAARHGGSCTVVIDPRVARNKQSLVHTINCALPGALSYDLFEKRDENAEVASILGGVAAGEVASIPSETAADFEIESIPEPEQPPQPEHLPPFAPQNEVVDRSGKKDAPLGTTLWLRRSGANAELYRAGVATSEFFAQLLGRVHQDVRNRIMSDRPASEGLLLFCKHLDPDNPKRDDVANRILEICTSEGLTAHLLELVTRGDIEPMHADLDSDREHDMPRDLERRMPRVWKRHQVDQLLLDLRTMTIATSRWGLAIPRASAEAKTEAGSYTPNG